MSERLTTRFNRIFFTLVFGALVMTFSINLIVDPFGLFGMPTWQGFNAEKTQYQKYLRMAKPHAVRVLQPRGLILGTSRAEYLDPDHSGWRADAHPVYNLAVQSARIHEVLRNLQHAQAQNRLKQVVLLLDDFMFDPRVQQESGFDEARLDSAPNPAINGAWVDDLLMSLLSYDALLESIATMRAQNTSAPVIYLPNGARHPERFQSAIDRVGGHRNLFMTLVRPAGRAFKGDDRQPYEDFRTLLMFCRAQGIDLRLVISPMHAHMLELYWLNGTWQSLEDWKRRLVRMVEDEAVRTPGAKPFPLWDFSSYNSITTEKIPSHGDAKTRMRWYWESSHFKTATGRLMLDRVLGTRSTELPFHEDFGVRLGVGNIEQHLQAIRVRHAEYASLQQADISEIALHLSGQRNGTASKASLP